MIIYHPKGAVGMEAKVIVNRWPLYEKIKKNPRYVRMDVLIDHELEEGLHHPQFTDSGTDGDACFLTGT